MPGEDVQYQKSRTHRTRRACTAGGEEKVCSARRRCAVSGESHLLFVLHVVYAGWEYVFIGLRLSFAKRFS